MTRVAFMSTYVPQKCGLATYTFHLRQAVHAAKGWKGTDPVVVLTQQPDKPAEDRILWPLYRHDLHEYKKMATKINQSDVDVVSLQHEFGIFGGEAGSHILTFLDHLKKPLVTTFHTVFERPKPPYMAIQKQIAEKSDKIIVMNRKAIRYLHEAFGIPAEKICHIPHGTPEPNKAGRAEWRKQWNWEQRNVLLTFGLLSRGKGLESLLAILPQVVEKVPNVLYAIVGQTHPEVKKREGEQYREELLKQIEKSGLGDHVVMIDRYMEESELVKCIMACDIYITPYPGLEQITSGTLAYAVGLGRPVLTTPYSYATDLLSDYPELFLDPAEPSAWAQKIISLLADDSKLAEWGQKIENIGKTMHWPEIGKQHAALFAEVGNRAYIQASL